MQWNLNWEFKTTMSFVFASAMMFHIVVNAGEGDARMLTLESIFSREEFNEDKIPSMQWGKNGSNYYELRKENGEKEHQTLVKCDIASGKEEVMLSADAFIPQGEKEEVQVDGFTFSEDEKKLLIYTNSIKVWRQKTRGDYWLLDLESKQLNKLGGEAEPSTMMFAKFSPDGSKVAYLRKRNIYVQDVKRLEITALTKDTAENIIHGTSDWVNEEELAIRDGFRWSPDSKSIAFWSFDTSGVGMYHLSDYTKGNYPVLTEFAYPKVGTTNSATKIGVVEIEIGKINWLKIPGDPREHYIPQMEWLPKGGEIIVQQMNRLQNTNKVMRFNLAKDEFRTILIESDPAWLENENPMRWVQDGDRFVWLSERSRWRHAYMAGIDGKEFTPITKGDFDLLSVEKIDEANGLLYFAASPENATQRYLFRVPLGGGKAERLSPMNQPGWHTYDFSPDGNYAVHRYSNFTTPHVVEVIKVSDHSVVRVLTDNAKLKAKLAELELPIAEFVKIDIGDGLKLDSWLLKPKDFDPKKKYPLMIYVYGEPHGQTVKDSWQGTRGLWHWMLAQQGYIVMSVDNRGTNTPRGREWRKCVYKKIGIIAPEEQAAAVNSMLKNNSYLDPKRVGVWGWSGGGSMTLNALFRYPDLYKTGIAVAPNANQLLYDTIYQERYMGLPSDNADGYRDGSPITHAENLKGNLLLVHGTGDDNGHYQGTETLINKLIAHSKVFSVMPYPARSHSINEGDNTVHHFYLTLTDYLHKNLPVGSGE